MIICDEYLALAALRKSSPLQNSQEQIAITPAAWTRALRSRHNIDNPQQVVEGQLSDIIGRLSPDGRAKLATPDPRVLTILDPRPFLDTTARLSAVYRMSYMAAEMAAASIFHQAPLLFAVEGNVPPGIRDLLQFEDLPGLSVAAN
ncbi:MAG: hypothetical protein OXI18_13780 [bacterium]|nr:hypothetical protein [bacterium]